MNITQQLEQIFGSRLKENESMSQHTNFRIGGPAKWFVEVKTIEELQHTIRIAGENDLKYFVFGGGSNMLVNDNGFDGIMIKIAMRDIQIKETTVRAEAGALSGVLARTTAQAGLSGLTWAATLPGTIGGAVRGNAGCFGGETKDGLVFVEVLRKGNVFKLEKEELEMSYRHSAIKNSKDIVLSATFELEQGDPEKLKEEINQQIEKRKSSQPFDAGSAGCLFKNYKIKDDEDLQRISEKLDIPDEMSAVRSMSVGWLIDKMDLKGKKIGNAQVSDKHGNFVLNSGNATADHVVQLVAFIKTRARDKYGILLEEEIEYVGF